MKKSSLVVVGTGIKFISQMTNEASVYIKKADKVLYLVSDPAMKIWISQSNQNTESLDELYFKHENRRDSYTSITNYIYTQLQTVNLLCVVVYGHPSIFSKPALDAVVFARQNGFKAKILPGISAEDCLYADLLIDPGSVGSQSFEATDFLLYQRKFDVNSHLLLWQPDVIGDTGHERVSRAKGLLILQEYLLNYYTESHEVIVYEAAQLPGIEFKTIKVALRNLHLIDLSPVSTLYVPPLAQAKVSATYLHKLAL